jgi:hypothetical protein
MNENTQRMTETTSQDGNTRQRITEVKDDQGNIDYTQNLIARIVWFIGGALITLLGFRFILSLLGANVTNSFADMIYSTSHVFVAPFFSLFRYSNYTNGVSHFEIYTLVAMLVYTVVTWGIVKFITLNREY